MDSDYGVRFEESSGAMAAVLRGAKEPFVPSLHQVCAQIFHHEDNGYITVTDIGVSHCLAHPTGRQPLTHPHPSRTNLLEPLKLIGHEWLTLRHDHGFNPLDGCSQRNERS